jgi:hypothetical protein
MVLPALGAFRMAVVDARFELRDRLLQRGAQGVIDSLGEDVGSGRHEVGRDPEGRAGIGPALHEHASLINLESRAQRLKLLLKERGEGARGLMVAMLQDEFHDGASLRVCSGFA